jgi:lyso-ornithine lipid O-acyltransferase
MRSAGRAATTAGALTREVLVRLAAGPTSPVDQAAALSRLFARLAARHAFAVELEGELPRGPAVLVANHLSYLDVIALLPLVPALPVCKGEVGSWPVLGPGARATGVLLVDRACAWSGARALRRALAALRGGACVLNFPEGTTTAGDQVLPFRRGIFGAARLAGIPVVPIALSYPDPDAPWIGDQTFVPHYLRTAAKERVHVRVAIGEPLWPGDRTAAELAGEARRRITTLLGRSDHVAAERVRVPETRPDSVLSAAVG